MPLADTLIDPPPWANNPPTDATVTLEQLLYIKDVLEICSSDAQFAQKALKAIVMSLTTSVNPTNL